MTSSHHQLGLFDTERDLDQDRAKAGRARMREMIARLEAATEPPWADEMAVILDDGSFQRAMHLVPDAEAQALWAEFDAQTVRLYTIFREGRPEAD